MNALIVPVDLAILGPMTGELDVNGTPEPGDFDRLHPPIGEEAVWKVPGINGTESVSHLDGVTLVTHDRRYLFRGSPEEAVPGARPDCASADAVTGVGDPGGLCRDCQFAQYGTAANGRGQACRRILELVFVRQQDRIPFIVSVPPSSLKTMRKFLMRLPLPHFLVLIRLSLATVRQPGRTYSVIQPLFLGVIDPKSHDQLAKLHRMLAD
jgi:hypothetical protein